MGEHKTNATLIDLYCHSSQNNLCLIFSADIIKENGHTGPVIAIKPLPLSNNIMESQSQDELTQVGYK